MNNTLFQTHGSELYIYGDETMTFCLKRHFLFYYYYLFD